MHMADTLLSPAVGLSMCAVSVAAIAYSAYSVKKEELWEKKIPLMGAACAFVFAAQMLNFAIPATGISGHISGGILLAAIIGAFPALLSMSAILTIQSLLFADGGLLALGCNIFNMGVVPCLIVYPLVFSPFTKGEFKFGKLTAASVIASVVALQIGAFFVVTETVVSGLVNTSFSAFLLLMQPAHLAIGIAEGVMTAAVLCFVYKTSRQNALATLVVIALLAGGVLSLFASANPDGLAWALEKIDVKEVASIQDKIALLPNYNFRDAKDMGLGTSVAGITGVCLTFLLTAIAFAFFAPMKKMQINASAPRH